MLRYEPRRMLGIAGVLVLGGLLLTALTTERWQMWLGMGIVLGLAPGLTALQLSAVISTRWFANRRGLVVGIMSSATATGAIIFMPLAAWMAEHVGWCMALVPAAVGVAAGLVLFLLLAKDRPRDLGLPPFGETMVEPAPQRANFVPIGTIGSGWLSDRYDHRWLLAWYDAARGLSLVWLVYADVSFVGLTIFAIIYGLDFIATVPPTVRLTVGTFGPELGPVIFAWIFAAHQLGVGIMAFGTGISRDALGTYAPAFLFAAVLCTVRRQII